MKANYSFTVFSVVQRVLTGLVMEFDVGTECLPSESITVHSQAENYYAHLTSLAEWTGSTYLYIVKNIFPEKALWAVFWLIRK